MAVVEIREQRGLSGLPTRDDVREESEVTRKAATLLREGVTLATTSHATGYASEASFSHAFRQWSGVAPGAWRKKLVTG